MSGQQAGRLEARNVEPRVPVSELFIAGGLSAVSIFSYQLLAAPYCLNQPHSLPLNSIVLASFPCDGNSLTKLTYILKNFRLVIWDFAHVRYEDVWVVTGLAVLFLRFLAALLAPAPLYSQVLAPALVYYVRAINTTFHLLQGPNYKPSALSIASLFRKHAPFDVAYFVSLLGVWRVNLVVELAYCAYAAASLAVLCHWYRELVPRGWGGAVSLRAQMATRLMVALVNMYLNWAIGGRRRPAGRSGTRRGPTAGEEGAKERWLGGGSSCGPGSERPEEGPAAAAGPQTPGGTGPPSGAAAAGPGVMEGLRTLGPLLPEEGRAQGQGGGAQGRDDSAGMPLPPLPDPVRPYRSPIQRRVIRVKIHWAEPEDLAPGYEQRLAELVAERGLHLGGVFVRRGCVELVMVLEGPAEEEEEEAETGLPGQPGVWHPAAARRRPAALGNGGNGASRWTLEAGPLLRALGLPPQGGHTRPVSDHGSPVVGGRGGRSSCNLSSLAPWEGPPVPGSEGEGGLRWEELQLAAAAGPALADPGATSRSADLSAVPGGPPCQGWRLEGVAPRVLRLPPPAAPAPVPSGTEAPAEADAAASVGDCTGELAAALDGGGRGGGGSQQSPVAEDSRGRGVAAGGVLAGVEGGRWSLTARLTLPRPGATLADRRRRRKLAGPASRPQQGNEAAARGEGAGATGGAGRADSPVPRDGHPLPPPPTCQYGKIGELADSGWLAPDVEVVVRAAGAVLPARVVACRPEWRHGDDDGEYGRLSCAYDIEVLGFPRQPGTVLVELRLLNNGGSKAVLGSRTALQPLRCVVPLLATHDPDVASEVGAAIGAWLPEDAVQLDELLCDLATLAAAAAAWVPADSDSVPGDGGGGGRTGGPGLGGAAAAVAALLGPHLLGYCEEASLAATAAHIGAALARWGLHPAPPGGAGARRPQVPLTAPQRRGRTAWRRGSRHPVLRH